MQITIYNRDSEEVAKVTVDEQTVYRGQLMGENKIVSSFSSPTPLDLQIGDYILHKEQEWRINEPVKETKLARNNFSYNVVFEGREYTWHNKQLVHEGVTDFSYFGTLHDVLVLVLNNINEIDAGWILAAVEETEEQLFVFTDKNCAQALTMIAEQVGFEYKFIDRTLQIKQSIGELIPDVVLSQGKGKGLYTLTRQNASESGVATRVRGYGGSTNLPANYRGGMRRLTFEERYIENNISLYGVIETSVTFPDIFPQRTGTVTSTGGYMVFNDVNLDFNLNTVIVQGQAKVVFKTGDLAGEEFEISKYDNLYKEILLIPQKEENGYVLPNATRKAKAGDKYTLVGIEMPPSYIATAENDVKVRTTEYAETIKHPPLSYTLEIDQLEAKKNGLDLNLSIGDKLNIVEDEWNVDEILRVQGITYPLTNPAKITAIINDKAAYTVSERIRKEVANHGTSIKEISKSSAELNRINAIRRRELQGMVFDPETGFYYTEKIKPLSIETVHLAVGTRSQEYSLTVSIKTSVDKDANKVAWTSGVLTHFTIAETIKTWTITSGSVAGLNPAKAYYIYAKCNSTGSTGVIVIDEVQRKVDSENGYYWFLVGILSSVIDGIRMPSLTYGSFEVNGGFIKGNRISSNDGGTYFDLDTGVFVGNFKFSNGQDIEDAIGKSVEIKGDQFFIIDGDNIAPDSITLTAKENNLSSTSGQRQWFFWNENTNDWTAFSTGLSINIFPGSAYFNGGDVARFIYQVVISGVAYSDTYEVVKLTQGSEGYTVVLSNEAHTVAASNAGIVSGVEMAKATTVIQVFKGADKLIGVSTTPGDGEFKYSISKSTGGTFARVDDENVKIASFASNATLSATAELSIIIENKQIVSKIFTVTKTAAGDKGAPGDPGEKGERGKLGPFVMSRGIWDIGKEYYGGADRIELVIMPADDPNDLPDYYMTTETSGVVPTGTPITDTNYWLKFTAVFDNIATGILFAKLAYIDNLGVRNLQTGIIGRKRVQIDGIENNFVLFENDGSIYDPEDPLLDRKVVEIDDDSTILKDEIYYLQLTNNDGGRLGNGTFTAHRLNNWSALNTGSIDERTGLPIDLKNGFPKGYSGFASVVSSDPTGDTFRYYFYKMGAGISVGLDVDLVQENEMGAWGGIFTNFINNGSYSQSAVRELYGSSDKWADGSYMPLPTDYKLTFSAPFSTSQALRLPVLYDGYAIDPSKLKHMYQGRMIEVIGGTNSDLTILTTAGTGQPNALLNEVGTGAKVGTVVLKSGGRVVFQLLQKDFDVERGKLHPEELQWFIVNPRNEYTTVLDGNPYQETLIAGSGYTNPSLDVHFVIATSGTLGINLPLLPLQHFTNLSEPNKTMVIKNGRGSNITIAGAYTGSKIRDKSNNLVSSITMAAGTTAQFIGVNTGTSTTEWYLI